MEQITAEQFYAWKQDAVTEALMEKLEEEREEMKEGLANSLYENESDVKGRCKALWLLLTLEHKDLLPSSFIIPDAVEEEESIYD